MKKHNFSAGPCILPQEVLRQAAEAVLNFNNDALANPNSLDSQLTPY